MRIHSDLADTIGNTPLLKLRKASEITGCTILGKAEFMNPGQSVKDRAALYIIKDAIADITLQQVLTRRAPRIWAVRPPRLTWVGRLRRRFEPSH